MAAPGVYPVGQIEPFNPYQKQGLTDFADGGDPAYRNSYMDAFKRAMGGAGDSGQYYRMATDMLGRGAGPVSNGDFASSISRYMSPYQQQVIDASVGDTEEAAMRRRNQILDRRAGSRSFGDTSMGSQLGEIDRGMLKDIGGLTSSLRYQGFGDALGQMNTERNQALQGSQIAGNMAGQTFSNLGDLMRFAQGGEDMRRQTILDKLNAGTMIQGQNQKLLDVIRPEIYAERDYPMTNLSNLATLLNQFPGSSTGAVAGQPNTLQTLGGLGMVAGSQWDNWFGGGGASPASMLSGLNSGFSWAG